LCPVTLVYDRNIQLREKGFPETVRSEQAVQIAALHTSIGGNRPFWRAVEKREGAHAIATFGPPDVDFVSFDRLAGGSMCCRHTCQGLLRRHHGRHVEQPKARGFARLPLDAFRVRYRLAKQLVS